MTTPAHLAPDGVGPGEPAFDELPSHVDVVVVGSGPVGAAMARELADTAPQLSVLMVEVGPRLTEPAGANLRNLAPTARAAAELRATAASGQTSSTTGTVAGRIAARPGTFLVRDPGDGDDQDGMPAAAMSANVGGMGAHWTCACPRPGGSERITFLGPEFDDAFDRACALLHVTTEAFPETDRSRRLRRDLSALFDPGRPADRRVQPMPQACTPTGAPLPHWAGADTVLGPLATARTDTRFQLRSGTLCRRLLHREGAVHGVELVDMATRGVRRVGAHAVVVAADALRTPQLLWASGIRPPALGRYLNDQPQIVGALALREPVAEEPGTAGGTGAATDRRDLLTGVLWIPFHEPDFPYHAQVMQGGTTPIEVPGAEAQRRPVITWSRFTRKEIRSCDRVVFSPTEQDRFGMPAMTIHYGLSDRDRTTVRRAKEEMVAQAAHVGDFFPGSAPRLLPAGSSLHYQGTVRMGAADDGRSVCGPDSRVWGFHNLYVAGNGVIPTATACNPTATSVALTVLAAADLARRIGAAPVPVEA